MKRSIPIILNGISRIETHPYHHGITALTAATLVLLAVPRAGAETNFWVGGGADLNWSTAANWSNNVPSSATDTFFHTDGAVPDATTVNNIVSSDLAVQSLTYLHVNQGNTIIHNTQIGDGVTLTVSNPILTTNVFMVGTGTNNASLTMTTTTISGLGGILSVNAPVGVLNVRNGGIGMYSGYAKLDLSGLGTFNANVSQAYLAGDGTNTEVGGPGHRQPLQRPRGLLRGPGPNKFDYAAGHQRTRPHLREWRRQ